MAGKFRAWAKNLGADVKRDVAQTLNQEASYARDDIRQKLVEQGWTGSVQTPRLHQNYAISAAAEPEQEEGVDIQGNPIEGADFGGTVWDQENRSGIEPMDVPDIPDQAPDIEPGD